MALICLGSFCFSLFQVAAIIFILVNYLSSFFHKVYTFFSGKNEIDKEIEKIQLKKSHQKIYKSKYVVLKENATIKDIFDKTKNSSVVIKFGSTNCKPCVSITDYFKSLIDFYDVTLVDIDVDLHEDLKEEHKITVLPTFLFYFFINEEWTLVQTIYGANPQELGEAFHKYCVSVED